MRFNSTEYIKTCFDKETIVAEFKNISGIDIDKIEPSCGCTKVKSTNKDTLKIKYKPEIPYWLEEYNPEKKILVTFKDGIQEILTIKLKVIKK